MLGQSKKRIIIIESDEKTIQSIAELMNSEEYEFFIFNDYNEAFAQIPRITPHFIIFAQSIDQYYGYDFSRQIKLNYKTNKIPVIMLEGTLNESFTYGLMILADEHYKKPVEPDLKNKILNLSDQNEDLSFNINFILSSDLQFLDLLIIYLTELLKDLSYSTGDIEDAMSGVYEIVANSIEWGNEFNRNLKVYVDFFIKDKTLTINVRDEGKGFECEQFLTDKYVPFEIQDDRIEKGKRLGGFGIKITQSFFDSIQYNRNEKKMSLQKKMN